MSSVALPVDLEIPEHQAAEAWIEASWFPTTALASQDTVLGVTVGI